MYIQLFAVIIILSVFIYTRKLTLYFICVGSTDLFLHGSTAEGMR